MTPGASPRLDGRTILGVFAHPDDESLACGGLLARATALGARVVVLCLTRGEGGPGGTPDLAARRSWELAEAGRTLGLAEVVLLNHEDGMLPWIAAADLEGDIHAAIARVRPDVVVTFGPDGLYWHPDHIAVHDRTTSTIAALGAAAPALYYVTLPPTQMRAVVDHTGGARPVVPGVPDPDAFGALADPPTLVIEAGDFARRKLAALLCHRSQFDGTALADVTPDDAPRLLGTEHYRRASVGGQGPTFLDGLGAPAASTAARRA